VLPPARGLGAARVGWQVLCSVRQVGSGVTPHPKKRFVLADLADWFFSHVT